MQAKFESAPFSFFISPQFALLWLPLRLYVGYVWLMAGWEKLISPAWIGAKSGTALTGFALGALKKTAGAHPDVQSWYAWFLQHVVLPHAAVFSYLVTFGEVLVGVALLAGALTGVAAFFGAFMNINYLLAGTVSVNPILLVIEVLLIAAWRTAGWWGLDRLVLPYCKERVGRERDSRVEST